ncbi:phosphoesterase [Paraliobacillus quinghaiensis]|uniref:Phosphoesterase n=1 Tax=Paraliobacillus quinghaiensis TaxID=470815 RepID=A0A917WNL0_9BACI|nr:metallophosphoesterase [Paraliobacillus quinghaiensis]GGM18928.1 phosphoesterase [Paraliobacillus quinghaiensis]
MRMRTGFILFTILATVISTLVKIFYDTKLFKVERVKVDTSKIPKGSSFTILQLSDIHNNVFGYQNEMLIRKVKQLNASIIVITGDLIDRKTSDFSQMFHLVEELVAMNKHVYFVSGNHEWGNPKAEEFFTGLKERKVTMLDNTNKKIQLSDVTFNLAGVADFTTAHDHLPEALNGIDETAYTVLLSHAPDIIGTFHEKPIDLTLCGHTHGGQIRFPIVGSVVARGHSFTGLDKGLYPQQDGKYIYVDSGIGTTGLPFRFLNQSQCSLITVKGSK